MEELAGAAARPPPRPRLQAGGRRRSGLADSVSPRSIPHETSRMSSVRRVPTDSTYRGSKHVTKAVSRMESEPMSRQQSVVREKSLREKDYPVTKALSHRERAASRQPPDPAMRRRKRAPDADAILKSIGSKRKGRLRASKKSVVGQSAEQLPQVSKEHLSVGPRASSPAGQNRSDGFSDRPAAGSYKADSKQKVAAKPMDHRDLPYGHLRLLCVRLKIPIDVMKQAYEVFAGLATPKERLAPDETFNPIATGVLKGDGFLQVLCRLSSVSDPSELAEGFFDQTFRSLDTDGDKSLDFEEFAQWFAQHGFNENVLLSEEQREIRQIARKYGMDVVQVETFKEAFDDFDLDDSGEIEFDEFERPVKICVCEGGLDRGGRKNGPRR